MVSSSDPAADCLSAAATLWEQGNQSDALASLRACAESHPDSVEVRTELAARLSDSGDPAGAEREYRAALGLAPSVDATYALAWVLYLQEKREAILETYHKQIAIEPAYAVELSRALARWLAAFARFEEAVELLRPLSEADPPHIGLALDLAEHLEALGQWDEAISVYDQAIVSVIGNQEQAQLHTSLAYAYARIAQPEKAFQHHAWAISLADEMWTRCGFANTLAEQRRYDEADAQYEAAISLDPDYAYAYHNQAYYTDARGHYKDSWKRWDAALKAYQRWSQKPEGTPGDLYAFQAPILQVFGRYQRSETEDGALEMYQAALENEPGSISALTSLAGLYLEMRADRAIDGPTAYWKARQACDKACRLLDERLERAPKSPIVMSEEIAVAEALIELEDFTRAAAYLASSIAIQPDDANVLADLGVLALRLEDYAGALRRFREALSHQPDDLRIRSNLAETYYKLGRYEDAERENLNVLKFADDHVESHIGLGQTYMAWAEQEKTEDLLEQAVHHFDKAVAAGKVDIGSKRLTNKELAEIHYARGRAKVEWCKLADISNRDRLLKGALVDFTASYDFDNELHKARRAKTTLEERLRRFSPQRLLEKVGPLCVVVLAVVSFVFAQWAFFIRSPHDLLTGADYAAVTFGSLLFLVAGMYLPQLLKLKVAGVELEKSSVDQASAISTLDITK